MEEDGACVIVLVLFELDITSMKLKIIGVLISLINTICFKKDVFEYFEYFGVFGFFGVVLLLEIADY